MKTIQTLLGLLCSLLVTIIVLQIYIVIKLNKPLPGVAVNTHNISKLETKAVELYGLRLYLKGRKDQERVDTKRCLNDLLKKPPMCQRGLVGYYTANKK